jgi:5,10-methylene-tetrahydrofolate dehydrogenase/methenyl tetrahydrofolate cyclohydrolase
MGTWRPGFIKADMVKRAQIIDVEQPCHAPDTKAGYRLKAMSTLRMWHQMLIYHPVPGVGPMTRVSLLQYPEGMQR